MANAEFSYGDKVIRVERPGKIGFVCSDPCRKTGKIRVQWGSRKTWNDPESLIRVLTVQPIEGGKDGN